MVVKNISLHSSIFCAWLNSDAPPMMNILRVTTFKAASVRAPLMSLPKLPLTTMLMRFGRGRDPSDSYVFLPMIHMESNVRDLKYASSFGILGHGNPPLKPIPWPFCDSARTRANEGPFIFDFVANKKQHIDLNLEIHYIKNQR